VKPETQIITIQLLLVQEDGRLVPYGSPFEIRAAVQHAPDALRLTLEHTPDNERELGRLNQHGGAQNGSLIAIGIGDTRRVWAVGSCFLSGGEPLRMDLHAVDVG
jgi:hypothetical protein